MQFLPPPFTPVLPHVSHADCSNLLPKPSVPLLKTHSLYCLKSQPIALWYSDLFCNYDETNRKPMHLQKCSISFETLHCAPQRMYSFISSCFQLTSLHVTQYTHHWINLMLKSHTDISVCLRSTSGQRCLVMAVLRHFLRWFWRGLGLEWELRNVWKCNGLTFRLEHWWAALLPLKMLRFSSTQIF